jgi:hypothetical protein
MRERGSGIGIEEERGRIEGRLNGRERERET